MNLVSGCAYDFRLTGRIILASWPGLSTICAYFVNNLPALVVYNLCRMETTVGEKLGALRQALGLKQDDFATILDVNRSTISAYEKKGVHPTLEKMRVLAERYGLDIGWFYNGKSLADDPVPEIGPNAVAIPRHRANVAAQSIASGDLVVLPTWRASGGMILGDGEFSFEDEVRDPTAVYSFMIKGDPSNYRVIIISGYSMVPKIGPGAQVVVKLGETPSPGVLTVVQGESGRLFLKVFVLSAKGEPELHSINDQYAPIKGKGLEGWQVRGVAVGMVQGSSIEWMGGSPLRV